MKKTNIIYWVSTVLFAGFMFFTAIPDIVSDPEAVDFISKKLGYPEYLLPFLGWAKTLGAVALLIPGFQRIKEWAYAGMFFDLVGATYSNIVIHGLHPDMSFMVVIFGLEAVSYIYYHKKLNFKLQ